MMIQRNRHPGDKVGHPKDYCMSWLFLVSWSELAVLAVPAVLAPIALIVGIAGNAVLAVPAVI
jgi:hypothetical protein